MDIWVMTLKCQSEWLEINNFNIWIWHVQNHRPNLTKQTFKVSLHMQPHLRRRSRPTPHFFAWEMEGAVYWSICKHTWSHSIWDKNGVERLLKKSAAWTLRQLSFRSSSPALKDIQSFSLAFSRLSMAPHCFSHAEVWALGGWWWTAVQKKKTELTIRLFPDVTARDSLMVLCS